jgi:hypothetical protein
VHGITHIKEMVIWGIGDSVLVLPSSPFPPPNSHAGLVKSHLLCDSSKQYSETNNPRLSGKRIATVARVSLLRRKPYSGLTLKWLGRDHCLILSLLFERELVHVGFKTAEAKKGRLVQNLTSVQGDLGRWD